jgi:hypothetical protein
MVRLAGFSAINSDQQEKRRPSTLEAQEAGVIESYENALRAVQNSRNEDAEVWRLP